MEDNRAPCGSPDFLRSLKDDGHTVFGIFGGILCIYHAAEYASVAVYNPRILSCASFLFSNSYSAAMIFAVLEYWAEARFLPWMKGWAPVTALGLAGCVFGDLFRKAALVQEPPAPDTQLPRPPSPGGLNPGFVRRSQAGHNFTHLISDGAKRPEHRLVTHGVYAASRHPGYFGWFVWSVSSQVSPAPSSRAGSTR